MTQLLDPQSLLSRRNPLVFAHRGASKSKPENTLEAFEEAINLGADGIELDVRRTRDGILVVHHNARAKKSQLPVRDFSLNDLASHYRKQGMRIATLEETLELCHNRALLDIELKEEGYEDEVAGLITRQFDREKVIFTSFHDSCVSGLKKVCKELIVGLLIGLKIPPKFLTRSHHLLSIRRVKASGADFVAPHHSLAKFGFIKRMNRAGLPVIAWTVDAPRIARRLRDRNVSGIITNAPDTIRAAILESVHTI